MITRDHWGIPQIHGADLREVAREQGRATAQDRPWQLEVERRRAEGTCAEIFGATALEWDRLVRRALLPDLARRSYAAMAAESRAFVDAYVDGVNDVLCSGERGDVLRRRPSAVSKQGRAATVTGPWLPWTPLGVFAVQHLLFSRFPGKLWHAHVRKVVGEGADDLLDLLRTDGLPGGSNAVAVAGTLTASGAPLLAGDPHRLLEAPGCYAQVRLVCTDADDAFDVAGLTFVGVPGVQHFGHAGQVAWGVTNAVADDEDVDVEQLVRRDGAVLARRGQAWEPVARRLESIGVRADDGSTVAEEVEVLVTERGPVVAGGPDDAESFSLRNPAWVLGNLGFDALLPLLRARSVDDVVAAFGHWVSPVNNLLVADAQGHVEHRVVGRVPVRADDGTWTDWVTDLPRRVAGPRHGDVLVTANDRATDEFARIGDDFAPPHRAARIAQRVGELTGPITPEMLATVLADDLQTAGEPLLAAIATVGDLSPAAAVLRDRLTAWDRRMGVDSIEAAHFAAVRAAVVERLATSSALDGLDGSPHGPLFAPWFDLRARLRVALPTLLARAESHESEDQKSRLGAPEVTIRGALEEVAAATGGSDRVRPWGDAHVVVPLTPEEQFGLDAPSGAAPLGVPVAGDDDCVQATRALGGTGACVHGPVARWVWDLAGQSRWVVPLGASGDPMSPHHHDQQPTWAAGGTLPLDRPLPRTRAIRDRHPEETP